MTRIILDAALLEKLHHLKGPLELCDESGQVRAKVVPTVGLSQDQPCEPPFSEEELQRREQSKGKRYTTPEVLAYLEKL